MSTAVSNTDTGDLVAGAVDMHCHFGPDAHLERSVDCLEAAEQARGLGMAAIVLKSHDYQTAALAYAVDKVTPGVRVFGGIALDPPVGGINPHAMEVMCRIGGKVVWMPTLSSENDHRKFGLPDARALDPRRRHPSRPAREARGPRGPRAREGVRRGGRDRPHLVPRDPGAARSGRATSASTRWS